MHTRWVPEALYRMWRNGVGLVIWLSVRGKPLGASYLQTGLFYRGSTVAKNCPKPALRAFRFPFVGFVAVPDRFFTPFGAVDLEP